MEGLWPLCLQWFHRGQPIPGATNRFFFVREISLADAGEYLLKAGNSVGQETGAKSDLIVRLMEPSGGVSQLAKSSRSHN